MDRPCIKQTVCKVLNIFQHGKYLVAYVLKAASHKSAPQPYSMWEGEVELVYALFSQQLTYIWKPTSKMYHLCIIFYGSFLSHVGKNKEIQIWCERIHLLLFFIYASSPADLDLPLNVYKTRYIRLSMVWVISTGFIQGSLSKIQGLFKDFSGLIYSFKGLKVKEKY